MMIPNDIYRIGDSSFVSYLTQETYTYQYDKLLQFQNSLTEILLQFKSYWGVSFFEYFPYGFVLYFYDKKGKRITNDVMLSPNFDNADHVLLRAKMMWERLSG